MNDVGCLMLNVEGWRLMVEDWMLKKVESWRLLQET